MLEIKKDGEVVLVASKFERSTLKMDNVVFAGVQADDSLFQKYRAAGLVVTTIGDVKKVRNLRGAVTDGANIGLTLNENLQINANAEIIASLPADIEL